MAAGRMCCRPSIPPGYAFPHLPIVSALLKIIIKFWRIEEVVSDRKAAPIFALPSLFLSFLPIRG